MTNLAFASLKTKKEKPSHSSSPGRGVIPKSQKGALSCLSPARRPSEEAPPAVAGGTRVDGAGRACGLMHALPIGIGQPVRLAGCGLLLRGVEAEGDELCQVDLAIVVAVDVGEEVLRPVLLIGVCIGTNSGDDLGDREVALSR